MWQAIEIRYFWDKDNYTHTMVADDWGMPVAPFANID